MDIFKDNKINNLIEELKLRLRINTISTQKDASLSAPRFIFVCGKAFEENQETIRSYIIDTLERSFILNEYGTKNVPVLCVISEWLYVQDLSEDLFAFEKMLAEISDRIIIIAESEGAFCELGAFVMDEKCMKKTTVINEDREEYKDSFITKGPLKLLENSDPESIILHNGFDRLKLSMEFEKK